MKKQLQKFGMLTVLVLSLGIVPLQIMAQGFKYQTVCRDADGKVMANTSVSFEVSIIKTSSSGDVVYTERHAGTTNDFGLIHFVIGNGAVQDGNFSTIAWGDDDYFLNVKFDPAGATSFINMGTEALMSVPFAMFSENAGSLAGTITASQVSDFATAVAGNAAVAANTAKNSYPTEDATKLAGIETGAEVNVQADWNAVGGDAQILNKPTLATVATSGSYNDLSEKPDLTALNYASTTHSHGAEDITWGVFNIAQIPTGATSTTVALGNHAHGNATTEADGFMSAADKTKLAGIEAGAEVNVNADWNAVGGDAQILNKPTLATVATSGSYDDLSEKPDLSGYATTTALDNKVDKVSGKALSTNDYSDADKSKLAGIETNAQVNVKSDWTAVSGDAQILNKPTLATVATSGSYDDLSSKPDLSGYATKNMGGVKITNLADPTDEQDAATKAYVDELRGLLLDIQAALGVKDIDGNEYKAVRIGNQVWMAENLKVTQYKDGTAIDYPGSNNTAWQSNITGAYAWYDNNEATYKNTYGALYNWHAVNTGKLCPTGWKVPSSAEWLTMEQLVDPTINNSDGWRGTNGGYKLKASSGWFGAGNGTDEYGFKAIAGSFRFANGSYSTTLTYQGWYWSSTPESASFGYYRGFWDNNAGVYKDRYDKKGGFSVRCIKE